MAKFIYSILIISLFFGCNSKNKKQTSKLNTLENTFNYQHKTTKNFPFKSFILSEVISIDLNNDSINDYVFIPAPSKSITKKIYVAITNKEGDISLDQNYVIEENRFKHIRHWSLVDLNNDGKKELILTDHGFDTPPFSGGISKAYSLGSKKLTNIKLPLVDMFTFNICGSDIDNDGDNDLYISNIDVNFGIPPFFLVNKNKKWKKTNLKLPKDLSNFNYSSLACTFTDFNNDGRIDLAIGRGEEQGQYKKHDLILFQNKNGHFKENKELRLPKRPTQEMKEEEKWVTSSLLSANLNNDNYQDLITLTHNKSMTQGSFNLLLNNKGKKFLQVPIDMNKSSIKNVWFEWSQVEDINGDGYNDIVLLPRDLTDEKNIDFSLIFLINNEGKSFTLYKLHSHLLKNKMLAGFDILDIDKDGDLDILAFHHGSNEYTILKNKTKR